MMFLSRCSLLDLCSPFSSLRQAPKQVHLLSPNLDVLLQRLQSPVQLQPSAVSPPKPIGQTSSPTSTEAPSTGRSGPGPGGSVGRPVIPPPPASTGPTDTYQGVLPHEDLLRECWR